MISTDKSNKDAVPQQHHEHICTCSAVVASRHQCQKNGMRTFYYL